MGKNPSQEEADTYDISRDMPVFMTVGENSDTSEGYTKYLKKCNTYFTLGYK